MNELEKGTPMGRSSPTSLCHGKRRAGWAPSPLVCFAKHEITHLDGHLKICKILMGPFHKKGRADILIAQMRKWHRTVRMMCKGITANKPWSQGGLLGQ